MLDGGGLKEIKAGLKYPPLLRVKIPGIGSAPSVTFSLVGCLSEISHSRFSVSFPAEALESRR